MPACKLAALGLQWACTKTNMPVCRAHCAADSERAKLECRSTHTHRMKERMVKRATAPARQRKSAPARSGTNFTTNQLTGSQGVSSKKRETEAAK